MAGCGAVPAGGVAPWAGGRASSTSGERRGVRGLREPVGHRTGADGAPRSTPRRCSGRAEAAGDARCLPPALGRGSAH